MIKQLVCIITHKSKCILLWSWFPALSKKTSILIFLYIIYLDAIIATSTAHLCKRWSQSSSLKHNIINGNAYRTTTIDTLSRWEWKNKVLFLQQMRRLDQCSCICFMICPKQNDYWMIHLVSFIVAKNNNNFIMQVLYSRITATVRK